MYVCVNVSSHIHDSPFLSKKEIHRVIMLKLEYLLFFTMGMGVLFPWNAIITAIDYFESLYEVSLSTNVDTISIVHLLRTITINKNNVQDINIELYFSVSYTWSLLISMILALMFKSLTSNRVMMFAGYITMMIVLLLFLCVSDPSVELSTFLAVIVGMGDAMAQSGLFAYAATTDSLYTSAVMAGNGTAGLIVGALRLLTKWAFYNTSENALYKSSRVYFAVCVFVILCAICSLHTLTSKTSFSSVDHLGDCQRLRDEDERDVEDEKNETSSATTVQPFDAILPGSQVTADQKQHSLIETVVLTFTRVRRLAAEASTYLIAMFCIFLITLALFPAIMVEIQSSSNLGDWWSVILIVIFNLFDTIGRTSFSSSLVRERLELWIKGNDRKLLVLVLSRALYVPLFWLCVKPDVLGNDILVILIVSTFALSNGVLSTYIITVGSNSFKDDRDKETVSNLIVLSLMFGLAVGSVFGVGLEALIRWV